MSLRGYISHKYVFITISHKVRSAKRHEDKQTNKETADLFT